MSSGRFHTTQWSVIAAAGGSEDESAARRGLAALCEAYWYPLYAFVRRQGYRAEDAQDLTQAFFAQFIERQDVRDVRRDRGRFRSYLLASAKHFMLNDLERRRALKRGGGLPAVPLEFEHAERRYANEPVDVRTPETIFDRRWALTVLDRTLARLQREAEADDKAREFDRLKSCLTVDGADGEYRELGAPLGMSAGAVKVAVHRLRRRYRMALREEISATVLTDEAVDDELQHLIRILAAR